MDGPSGRRSRREERKAETRAELIASAIRVFARRGFNAGALEQVAQEAGYSTGAIYWHFRNKEELFLAAFEAYASTRVQELSEIYAQGTGPLPERARAYADHWMARQAADPTFMVIALEFLVYAWRHPELREAFGTRMAAVRLALGRFLEQEAREAGLPMPMPAQEIATAFRELGVGLALAKLADPDAFPDRLFGDFVQVFFEQMITSSELTARDEREEHG